LWFDWGTYRLLTEHAGLNADQYQQWIADYYQRMFSRRRSGRACPAAQRNSTIVE
jgi:hypothetical protein